MYPLHSGLRSRIFQLQQCLKHARLPRQLICSVRAIQTKVSQTEMLIFCVRWWTATVIRAKNALLAYKTKISLTQCEPVPRLASPHLSAKTSDSAVIQPQWVLSLIHHFVPPSGNHTTLLIRLFQDPFVHHTLLLRCFQCLSLLLRHDMEKCARVCFLSLRESRRSLTLAPRNLIPHPRVYSKISTFYWGRVNRKVYLNKSTSDRVETINTTQTPGIHHKTSLSFMWQVLSYGSTDARYYRDKFVLGHFSKTESHHRGVCLTS